MRESLPGAALCQGVVTSGRSFFLAAVKETSNRPANSIKSPASAEHPKDRYFAGLSVAIQSSEHVVATQTLYFRWNARPANCAIASSSLSEGLRATRNVAARWLRSTPQLKPLWRSEPPSKVSPPLCGSLKNGAGQVALPARHWRSAWMNDGQTAATCPTRIGSTSSASSLKRDTCVTQQGALPAS